MKRKYPIPKEWGIFYVLYLKKQRVLLFFVDTKPANTSQFPRPYQHQNKKISL